MQDCYNKFELRHTERIIKETLGQLRSYIRNKGDDIFAVFTKWVYLYSHFCPTGAYDEFELFIIESFQVPKFQIRYVLEKHLEEMKIQFPDMCLFPQNEEYLALSQKLNVIHLMKRRRTHLKSLL